MKGLRCHDLTATLDPEIPRQARDDSEGKVENSECCSPVLVRFRISDALFLKTCRASGPLAVCGVRLQGNPGALRSQAGRLPYNFNQKISESVPLPRIPSACAS